MKVQEASDLLIKIETDFSVEAYAVRFYLSVKSVKEPPVKAPLVITQDRCDQYALAGQLYALTSELTLHKFTIQLTLI